MVNGTDEDKQQLIYELDNSFITKRRKTFTASLLFFFSCGLDYFAAIIIPSCWLYLQDRFQADAIWLGVVIGSFSVSSLLCGPFTGRLSDQLGQTRAVMLIAMLFPIIGNFMYSLAVAPWFLALARFIAGFGAAQFGIVQSAISIATSKQERTVWVTASFMALIIGSIVGPTLHLGLTHIHFYIGPFLVDGLASPGIALAVFHVVLYLIICICYYDIKHPEHTVSETAAIDQSENKSASGAMQEMLQLKIAVLLLALLIAQFDHNSSATGLTALTESIYKFGDVENSYIFLYCSVIILLTCIVIGFLVRCVQDKTMTLAGIIMVLVSQIVYCIVVPLSKEGDVWSLVVNGIAIGVHMAGSSLVFCACDALLSKLTSKQNQGVTFGTRQALIAGAEISAPLWAGATALRNLYVYFGAMVFLQMTSLIMILAAWKQLHGNMETPKTSEKLKTKLNTE